MDIKKRIEAEKKKTPLKTKLEAEKEKERKVAAGQEYLDYVAVSDEEKGAEAVIEIQRQVEKKEAEEKAFTLHCLNRSRKQFSDEDYQYRLAKKLYEMLSLLSWPRGYQWTIEMKDRSLAVLFKANDNNVYGRGIKLSFDPKYDLHGLEVLTTRAENTIDMLEGNLAWQRNAIIGLDGRPLRSHGQK